MNSDSIFGPGIVYKNHLFNITQVATECYHGFSAQFNFAEFNPSAPLIDYEI